MITGQAYAHPQMFAAPSVTNLCAGPGMRYAIVAKSTRWHKCRCSRLPIRHHSNWNQLPYRLIECVAHLVGYFRLQPYESCETIHCVISGCQGNRHRCRSPCGKNKLGIYAQRAEKICVEGYKPENSRLFENKKRASSWSCSNIPAVAERNSLIRWRVKFVRFSSRQSSHRLPAS